MISKSLHNILCVFACATVITGLFVAAIPAYGQTVSKDELQQKIADLERQMAAIDKELAGIANTKQTLSSHISELQLSRKKLASQISAAELQLKKEKSKVADLQSSIDEHTQTQAINRATLGRLLREVRAADDENGIVLLLSATDARDFMQGYSELPLIFTALGSATRNLALVNQALASEKSETEATIKKTTELTSQIKGQKSVYDSLHKEASTKLATTAQQEKEYQAQREALAKLKAAFEQELYTYEAGLGFAGFSKNTPKRGTVALAWPLDSVFVTQLFGKTSASARLYLSGSHSGVDFRASIGTPVRAMASGTVIGTGDTDLACRGASFGKWIYIAFDNGLGATYGHLSSVSAQKGQKVSAGDLIGYSGQTGHATGPHLHVSLYALKDTNENDLVQIAGKESNACKGKILVQPRAPVEAYLNLLDFSPSLDANSIKY